MEAKSERTWLKWKDFHFLLILPCFSSSFLNNFLELEIEMKGKNIKLKTLSLKWGKNFIFIFQFNCVPAWWSFVPLTRAFSFSFFHKLLIFWEEKSKGNRKRSMMRKLNWMKIKRKCFLHSNLVFYFPVTINGKKKDFSFAFRIFNQMKIY